MKVLYITKIRQQSWVHNIEYIQTRMNRRKRITHGKKRKTMKYGAVHRMISSFHVRMKYAFNPMRAMLKENANQRVMPACGRNLGPTNSDIKTNIWTEVPGMKKPMTTRATA